MFLSSQASQCNLLAFCYARNEHALFMWGCESVSALIYYLFLKATLASNL